MTIILRCSLFLALISVVCSCNKPSDKSTSPLFEGNEAQNNKLAFKINCLGLQVLEHNLEQGGITTPNGYSSRARFIHERAATELGKSLGLSHSDIMQRTIDAARMQKNMLVFVNPTTLGRSSASDLNEMDYKCAKSELN